MKSPLSVDHNDILKEEQKTLKWMKENYPARVRAGGMPADVATRKIALKEALIKHLLKTAPVRQLKLGE
ncbi:MAG: hypothetical protein ACTHMC_09755 [Pseudobacter sp.]|uniref:hypothetical protein n=1 Tax=Pseudobacter sp. TaxID=2045420 RepID=UPI003F81C090